MFNTDHADEAIARVLDRATEYATARADEMALEDHRAIVKQDAILRIMQVPNILNGKPHSMSSAEAIVETDEEYRAHRRTQREAAIACIMTRARYDAAKFRAHLLCNLVEAQS